MNEKTCHLSNGHASEFVTTSNNAGMLRNGRFCTRMGKTLGLPLAIVSGLYLLVALIRNIGFFGTNLSLKSGMTVGFYNRLDLKGVEMPEDIWGLSISEYSVFPEIVEAVEKHYTPVCEARCSGRSADLLNLVRQGECLHLWPFAYVLDAETNMKTENNSTASIPCFMNLGISRIKNAGRGIFTNIDLQPGLLFGPYKGYIVYDDDKISAYAWQIFYMNNSSKYFYVDAGHPSSSNWMRYVNSARFEEEQNVFPFPINENIYYLVYKRIPANGELLTWYGPGYAKSLGFKMKKGKEESFPLIAPPKKDFIVIND